MKYGLALVLLAALAAPTHAATETGVLKCGSYAMYLDSIKFAIPTGVVTFLTPGWNGNPGSYETATFSMSGRPTALMLYYRCENQTPTPLTGPFMRDSVYWLNTGTLPPRQVFPQMWFLDTIGSIEEASSPELLSRLAVSPSPFARSTAVRFSLARGSAVRVEVCDRAGRVVRVLRDGWAATGSHTLVWDGRNSAGSSVPAGVYFARAISPEGVSKFLFVRTN
jgi:hypothetical protein